MYVLNIVNSFIGKKGNIGIRTAYIINELNKQNIENFSYSRGVIEKYKKNNINMGILGHLPRILNAYRIYFNNWYNHRKHDILIFDKFFQWKFKDVNYNNKIAHIWENSPNIIKILKKKGYITILDVPIAPTATVRYLVEKFGKNIGLHFHEYNEYMERKSYELVDYIVAPSIFVKNEIIKLGIDENKIFVVPFGTDLQLAYEKKFIKNYKKKGIDFVFAGTINRRKGIEFLLEAWKNEKFKNDRLHLCGRLYPEIEKLLKKYNFKNVIIPGFVDVREYFKKCDVYVFPSLLEGSSKSIYEAMSMSLPCIVTHNSGSIIQNEKDGFIINIASSDEIEEKMLLFKERNELICKMGKQAYQNIQKYSWENYANNIINIYKKVIKK